MDQQPGQNENVQPDKSQFGKPQALGVMQFNFTADFDVNVPPAEQNEMIREQIISMLDQIPGLKIARNTVNLVVQIPREGYRVVPRIVDQQPK